MNKNISNKYYNFAKNQLRPIYRSITGKGNLETLELIKQKFPDFKIKYFNSGEKVFDWTVPREWNVNDAYILDKHNNKQRCPDKIFALKHKWHPEHRSGT